jgi:hypothetical protein
LICIASEEEPPEVDGDWLAAVPSGVDDEPQAAKDAVIDTAKIADISLLFMFFILRFLKM